MDRKSPPFENLQLRPHPRFAMVFLNAIFSCLFLVCCSSGSGGKGSNGGGITAWQNQSYSTSFPATENPISEGGKWINGRTTGLSWADVQTRPGLAFGTNVSGGPPYSDPTAVLTGTWGSNQKAQATVHTVNQTSKIYEEVELRLRSAIATYSDTGYEINFRCTSDGSQYVQIVRWNGRLNSYTYVNVATGPGLHDGDVVMATAIGNTITAYINGTQIVQGTDSRYMNGSPGMGFYNQGGTVSDNANYGFTSFTASDMQ
jgi:hypothetical protein